MRLKTYSQIESSKLDVLKKVLKKLYLNCRDYCSRVYWEITILKIRFLQNRKLKGWSIIKTHSASFSFSFFPLFPFLWNFSKILEIPKCLNNHLIHFKNFTKFLHKSLKHCLEQFPSSLANMSIQSFTRWYALQMIYFEQFYTSLKHCWNTFVSVLKSDCEQTYWSTCS